MGADFGMNSLDNSLGAGDALPLTTCKDPNLSPPNCVDSRSDGVSGRVMRGGGLHSSNEGRANRSTSSQLPGLTVGLRLSDMSFGTIFACLVATPGAKEDLRSVLGEKISS